MKRIRILSGLALLVPFLAIADKIDYSANEDGIQISYVIENLYQEESLLYPGTTKFMIENFGVLEADNYPSLLQKIESFQIPEGKKVGNISYTAETDGDNGNAYLKSIDAFSVIVMEKDGVVVDSKRIINK